MNYLLDTFIIVPAFFLALALGDIIGVGAYKIVRPERDRSQEKEEDGGKVTLIKGSNYVEKQQGPSCGGFATAYVLRHFGIEAKGMDIYGEMFKAPGGSVHLREVRKALRKRGIKETYCKGSIETIQDEIDKGYPVILFITPRPKVYSFHFSVAVGYDDEHIYVADSAYDPKPAHMTESGAELPYNRMIKKDYFLEIWNTGRFFMPTYRYTYITVRPHSIV